MCRLEWVVHGFSAEHVWLFACCLALLDSLCTITISVVNQKGCFYLLHKDLDFLHQLMAPVLGLMAGMKANTKVISRHDDSSKICITNVCEIASCDCLAWPAIGRQMLLVVNCIWIRFKLPSSLLRYFTMKLLTIDSTKSTNRPIFDQFD